MQVNPDAALARLPKLSVQAEAATKNAREMRTAETNEGASRKRPGVRPASETKEGPADARRAGLRSRQNAQRKEDHGLEGIQSALENLGELLNAEKRAEDIAGRTEVADFMMMEFSVAHEKATLTRDQILSSEGEALAAQASISSRSALALLR